MSHEPDALRAPTVDSSGHRRWIYPDRRSGRLSGIRGKLAILLFFVYIGVPFSTIGGFPLLRVDMMQGTIFVFGQAFQFSDAYYLVFVFLAGSLALGFVTSVWGRIWCGYACPQTVFVEWIIRPIEEWVEGSALQRKRRDAGPKNLDYWYRKIVKHGIYVGICWLITNAFLAYFVDPTMLFSWIIDAPSKHSFAFVSMIVLFSMIYFDLVWFREQFCSFLCPYARFQSVMISKATPTVAYDTKRGEPRGKHTDGDCIDCGLCVRVCPTGIDIRNGLQLECIQCGRCVDACHGVMTNVKRPTGLIRTASELELDGIKARHFRLRPALYLALFMINIGVVSYALGSRKDLAITVLRQPGTTYSKMGPLHYGNYFSIRVVNQTNKAMKLVLADDKDVRFICSLCNQEIGAREELKGNLVVVVPMQYPQHQVDLRFEGSSIKLPLLQP